MPTPNSAYYVEFSHRGNSPATATATREDGELPLHRAQAPPQARTAAVHHHHHHHHHISHGTRSTAGSTTPNTVFSVRRGKRIFNREIAFLMLMFAAQTVSEIGALGGGLLSTEVMADAYGFAERPSVDGDGYHEEFCYNSYTTTMPGGKFVPLVDPMDGALTSSSSNTGDREDEEDEKEYPSEADLEALSILSNHHNSRNAFLQDAELWDRVMSFLPWRELLETRRVSRFMLRHSLGFAAVLRMPHTKHRALFLPCREDLDTDEAGAEAALRSTASRSSREPWQCARCGHCNDNSHARCATSECGADRPQTGCRMFLGQLRRNGTVKMVEWLLNYVFDAPRGALVSVENHRNANTGRGKGCAWPTIADAATVDRLLLSHHRLFYDRVGGVEGVWLVPQGQEGALQAETDDPARGGHDHPKHMPRNLMVFELPAGQQRPSTATALPPPQYWAGSGKSALPAAAAAAKPQFQCPVPRSLQQRQRVAEAGSTTATTAATSTTTSAATPTFAEGLSHSSESAELNFAPFYNYEDGRLYVSPGVYRHYPYAPLTFQL